MQYCPKLSRIYSPAASCHNLWGLVVIYPLCLLTSSRTSSWFHLELLSRFRAWFFRIQPWPVQAYFSFKNMLFWVFCFAHFLPWVFWTFRSFRTQILRNRTVIVKIRIRPQVFEAFLKEVSFFFIASTVRFFLLCSWCDLKEKIPNDPFVPWYPQ